MSYLGQKGFVLRPYSRSPKSGVWELAKLPQDIRQGEVGVILHLAWSVVPAEAELEPKGQWRDDLPQLGWLLDVIAERNHRCKAPVHLIFFSSGSVYGEGEKLTPPFEEQHPRNPKGLYAQAKADAEDMIRRHVQQGMEATILRVTNVYGFPQKEGRPQGVIPAFFNAAHKKEPFSLWGDGSAMKDYLYIQDFCCAVEKVIQGRLLGVFNLAGGESVALQEVLEMIQKMLAVSVSIRQVSSAAWDVHYARYSSRRLQEECGWAPNFSLQEGLLKYWHEWKTSQLPAV
jgi:UDP-glucose 4-epimerase